MARKPQKQSLTVVAGSAPTVTEPPTTLGETGSNLWRSIQREYAIVDSGGLELLRQACAAADRAEECAAMIAEQGAVIHSKGGLRDHPLLKHETAARARVAR